MKFSMTAGGRTVTSYTDMEIQQMDRSWIWVEHGCTETQWGYGRFYDDIGHVENRPQLLNNLLN